MPLYEYLCRQCQNQVELLVRGDEAPTCLHCAGHDLEKLLSVPAPPMSSRASSATLPLAGGCGRPQCAAGGCQNL